MLDCSVIESRKKYCGVWREVLPHIQLPSVRHVLPKCLQACVVCWFPDLGEFSANHHGSDILQGGMAANNADGDRCIWYVLASDFALPDRIPQIHLLDDFVASCVECSLVSNQMLALRL